MNKQQYILTIAGFDPSNGAGLTSDLKTFHAHGLYGLSVCTTVTVQNDVDFKSSHWVKPELILEQIETLFERFEIEVVKIGIVESWKTLSVILESLKALNPTVRVVLDPVLKATAGYDFHSEDELSVLDSILDSIFVITPNFEEIKQLYPEKTIEDTIEFLSSKTNLYLKGGHRTDQVGLDQLFYDKIVQLNIEPRGMNISPKHGSGCVLSSSLASNLMLGHSIEEAAVLSKRYTEQFLSSNTSLLGNHITLS
ncbi:MAG: hydroxymethylpyrimidine/phosphomethylpyrimidine kinase [Crocinitomicaceae bacterium]|nr:hydroxymethylpyrimidine/phosphomethylpyrimidine kinase [Crocinitomicaceae bacterium]